MESKFEGERFSLQLIAKGSYIDDGSFVSGDSFLIETYTVRLNRTALNEWIFSETFNTRLCFNTEQ